MIGLFCQMILLPLIATGFAFLMKLPRLAITTMLLAIVFAFTIVIATGTQNSALAITIASRQVFPGNPQMAVHAVIYVMLAFLNTAIFGYFINKWIR